MPCEKAKDTCYIFDFTTGKTEFKNLESEKRFAELSILLIHLLFMLFQKLIFLYCFDRNYKIKWSKDFNDIGRINSSDIYITDNNIFIAVEAQDVKANDWGTDFCN